MSRSLLTWPVLLLVVGILGCGTKVEPGQPVILSPEQQAIAEIEKLGGRISYEIDPLTPARRVDLANTQVNDADLVHLKDLTSVQFLLDLANTQISDDGLVHFKKVTNLQTLFLNATLITDLGLEHLKGLTELQTLNLSGTEVSDAGLVHLKEVAGLETLDLSYTQVTDAGVNDLQEALPNLNVQR